MAEFLNVSVAVGRITGVENLRKLQQHLFSLLLMNMLFYSQVTTLPFPRHLKSPSHMSNSNTRISCNMPSPRIHKHAHTHENLHHVGFSAAILQIYINFTFSDFYHLSVIKTFFQLTVYITFYFFLHRFSSCQPYSQTKDREREGEISFSLLLSLLPHSPPVQVISSAALVICLSGRVSVLSLEPH